MPPPEVGDHEIEIEGLGFGYRLRDGRTRHVVRDVDLRLASGEVVGLVGESGCGKSTLAMAVVGWLGATGVHLGGSVRYRGRDLYELAPAARRKLWGDRLVYLPQDAGTALHPTKRIGWLFDEVLSLHSELDAPARREHTLESLARVEIADTAAALRRYPHQFSGGQKQRLALALALATRPDLLVLDEPTTGADVTTQAHLADLLRELLPEQKAAVLYVTHDIALLSRLADRLAVMYAGEVVEAGPTSEVLTRPLHPYTAGLVAAVPRPDGRPVHGIAGLPPAQVVEGACGFAARCALVEDRCRRSDVALDASLGGRLVRCLRAGEAGIALNGHRPMELAAPPGGGSPRLALRALTYDYRDPVRGRFRALDGVTIEVLPGEIVGIVGESGSGKSTVLATAAGLGRPTAGTVELDGVVLADRARKRTTQQLRAVQIVFQDPQMSLNPRQTVEQIMANALRGLRPELDRAGRAAEIGRLLALVQLSDRFAGRYPHQLSGGQRQRVALARALAGSPEVLLCDEVISALDVSVQAGVLNLLLDIRRETGCAILFVSHDLAAVRTIADRIYVLRRGEVREVGDAAQILDHPQDVYTQTLVAAVPALPAPTVGGTQE